MVQPKEEFTITEDYAYHTQLDIEEGQTAAYRIEVDSTVIAEGTIPYNELN